MSVFNTFHLGNVSFFPLLLVMYEFQPGKPLWKNLKRREILKEKEVTVALLGRGELALKAITYTSIITISQIIGTRTQSYVHPQISQKKPLSGLWLYHI